MNSDRPRPTFDLAGPRIYVDFLNTDGRRRLKLNLVGTREDLSQNRIDLRDGLRLLLYSDDADANGTRDDLLVEGTALFDAEHSRWVAEIDWDAIRHESDLRLGRDD
jgi:hypothetical protein